MREVHPEPVEELVALLEAEGEHDLAVAVRDMRRVRVCGCPDDHCQSFYTYDHPEGERFGEGHRTVVLLPETGMLNLDVAHGRIMCVEVLGRPLRGLGSGRCGGAAATAPGARPRR